MNYGLTIYGPFIATFSGFEDVVGRLRAVFPAVTERQAMVVWDTMLNYPYANNIEIAQRISGDLIVHLYGKPLVVPEDADCIFHAKISPAGIYA